MYIKRKRKEDNFTRLPNEMLRDDRISWKARGLLSYMLSMPDDWVFYDEELIKHSKKDGTTSLKSAIKELKEFGYFKREALRDEKGKMIKWVTYVDDNPIQFTENPPTGKPTNCETHSVDNQQLLTTNSLLTNKDTNIISVDKSTDANLVIEHYKKLKNLPQPRKITTDRIKSINARINDFGLDEVLKLLTKFNESKFVEMSKGKPFLTIDWIFSPKYFTRMSENKYFWEENKKVEIEDAFDWGRDLQ